MPVQMIELEEVMMVEVSDAALEATVPAILGANSNVVGCIITHPIN